jgi:hypothetical protein
MQSETSSTIQHTLNTTLDEDKQSKKKTQNTTENYKNKQHGRTSPKHRG